MGNLHLLDRWSEAGQDIFAGEEKVAWSPPSSHPVAEGGGLQGSQRATLHQELQ